MNKNIDQQCNLCPEIHSSRGNRIIPAIGSSFPRVDARAKVTGEEKFASDCYAQDFVWAGVKRAGVAHGKIMAIDCTGARRLPGVMSVLTHADIRGTNRQGVVRKDQPVLVDKQILHRGDPLALVISRSKDFLAQALDLIRLDYEALPPVLDPEKAMRPGSPIVQEGVMNNILLDGELETGKGALAEQECDALVEEVFQTQAQEHSYLETECGWAYLDDSGRITVVCSTQAPFRDRAEIAEALGIEIQRIRIIAPYPGGAFGGKDGVTVQSLLALAALHSEGLPAKMYWGREESFLAGTKRHPARIYMKLGAKSNGELHYLDARIYLDTGPYDHLGGVVLAQALEHLGGPYRIPSMWLRGWCVHTNNPIGGAFRGFGATQATAAIEQCMDVLAQKLAIDPLELRLKNSVRKGDRNAAGKTLTGSTGIMDCLQTLQRHELWRDRSSWKNGAAQFKRRGIGIAAMMQAIGYGPVVPDYANAKVELTDQGKVRLYCGVVDMGQGNTTANIQIASFILSQSPDVMEFVLPDTDHTLPSCSASASRCTYAFGNALISACEVLKNRILRRAADMLIVESERDLELVPSHVRCTKSNRNVPLSALAQALSSSEKIAVGHFRAAVRGEVVTKDEKLRFHGLPHNLFSYAAHLVGLEIDELTGKIDVRHYVSVSDCGNVMNPQVYEQQIQGGIAQGIGYALCEDLVVAGGEIMNPTFAEYILPSTQDIPDIHSISVSLHEPTGPFGLKGIGEISMNGPLPAISNAVTDAIGIRFTKYPMTPERILLAMHSQKDRDFHH